MAPPRTYTLALVASAALAAFGASGCGGRDRHPFLARAANGRGLLVFAHRGGGGLGPEATLPRLLAAHRDTGAVVEFDVHRSRDGKMVVIHDDTVDRTTNGTGKVAELTWDELRGLDAGHCASPGMGDGTDVTGACRDPSQAVRFAFRNQGYRIPSLEEVLATLPMDAFISIEVKAPGFEAAFADLLRGSGRMDRLVVGSEYDDIAVRLQDVLPELPHYYPKSAATCLALASKFSAGYPCPEYDLFAAPLSGAGLALDTDGVLEAAHERGIGVIYWTINDEPTMDRLARLGADGIFTDYPDRGVAVRQRFGASGR